MGSLNLLDKIMILFLVICGAGASTWACLKGDQEAIPEETSFPAYAQEGERQSGQTLQRVQTTDTNTQTENLSLVEEQTSRGKVKKKRKKRRLRPLAWQDATQRYRQKKDAAKLLHNLVQVDPQTGLHVEEANEASLDDAAPVGTETYEVYVAPAATETHQVDSLTSSFWESHPVPASERRTSDDIARDFIMGLPEVVEGKNADRFVDFLKTISKQHKPIAPTSPSSVSSPNKTGPPTILKKGPGPDL